ncbi:MAG: hypothetical protein GOV15_00055 [Candidatus Diapherotrites archaeon]|nr:hypothetical protein [Candidatus Diapherotrites archaeon]
MKRNPLLPTLKPRKRYLEFVIESSDTFDKKEVHLALNRSLMGFLGQVGFADAGLQLIEFDEKVKVGVLQCALSQICLVRSGLLFFNGVNGVPARVRVLSVSGTLKTLRDRR